MIIIDFDFVHVKIIINSSFYMAEIGNNYYNIVKPNK